MLSGFEIDFLVEKIQKQIERKNVQSNKEKAKIILDIALAVCIKMDVSPEDFFIALMSS